MAKAKAVKAKAVKAKAAKGTSTGKAKATAKTVPPAEAKSKKDAGKKTLASAAIPKAGKAVKSAKEPQSPKLEKKLPPVMSVDEESEAIDSETESVSQEIPEKATKQKKEPKPKKEKSAKKLAAEKAIADENKKWADYKEKYKNEKAAPYSMSGVFEPHQPLQHKVLGWGYIVSIQNDRLEVLFEQGTKMLISNYKTK